MSMQDPIADMIVRIKNAQAVFGKTVSMPSSNIKVAIAKVLKEEGFISDYEVTGDIKKSLLVHLKYYEGQPVIEKMKRVSRPGLRVYKSAKDLLDTFSNFAVSVVSTSSGVMSVRQALRANIGGEILLELS